MLISIGSPKLLLIDLKKAVERILLIRINLEYDLMMNDTQRDLETGESEALLTKQRRNRVFEFLHSNILPIQAALWTVVYVASEVQYRKELSEKSEGAEIHLAASALGTIGMLWIIGYSFFTRNSVPAEDLKYTSGKQYLGDVLKRMITPPVHCLQNVDLRRFFSTNYVLTNILAVTSYSMLGKDITPLSIAYPSCGFSLGTTALACIPKKETAYIAFGLIVGVPQTYPLVERIISPQGYEGFLITDIAMVTSSALAVGVSIASHAEAVKKAEGVSAKAKAVFLG